MTFNVSFAEQNERISPQFGEVHNISDGGYERGYAQGYIAGEKNGKLSVIVKLEQLEQDLARI